MIKKTFISLLFLCQMFSYTPLAFSQEAQKKNVLIINNEASVKAQTQAITAPALVPSEAKKLRDAREKQEIKTEDTIMKELEKQRLLDEQKRVDKLFNKSSQELSIVQKTAEPKQWFFGNKSFISFGAGVVSYPGVENINSTNFPALFLSFGGYGYKGHLMFDLSLYHSEHYLRTPNVNYQDIREGLNQPAVAMAVKISPLTGRMKPYAGVSGSLVFRQWFFVHKSGESLSDNPAFKKLEDVADKKWNQSFDAGLTVGADMALGDRLGLNVDIRYHWNLYTENRKTVAHHLTDIGILDQRDSVIFSGNLRYYF